MSFLLIILVIIGWQICCKLDTIIENFSKLDELYKIVDVLKTIDRKNTMIGK